MSSIMVCAILADRPEELLSDVRCLIYSKLDENGGIKIVFESKKFMLIVVIR